MSRNRDSDRYVEAMFTAALSMGQKVEATQVSIRGQTDRRNVVHPHYGMLFSLEMGGDSGTCSKVADLEDRMLNDVSQI